MNTTDRTLMALLEERLPGWGHAVAVCPEAKRLFDELAKVVRKQDDSPLQARALGFVKIWVDPHFKACPVCGVAEVMES